MGEISVALVKQGWGSLAEPDPRSAWRVWGHGHTKFVICSGGMWKW